MSKDNENAEFVMPIAYYWILEGFPSHVRISMEMEDRAKKNYQGQCFTTLARRGGLEPDGAIAIIEDREWRKMNVVELVDAFRKYHWL